MKIRTLALFLSFLTSSLYFAFSSQDAGNYQILDELKLGGDGSWDLLGLDDASGKLYISRGKRVMVVDLKTGKLSAEIQNTPGAHDIAVATEFNRGFITCGSSNCVKVFDLTSLSILETVPTGKGPDIIFYEPISKHVFAFDHPGKDVVVIDAATSKVIKTIPLEGEPELAVSDSEKVYVNLEDTSEVIAIDIKDLTVSSRMSLKPGTGPTGLAIDRKNHRLYSACGNHLMVILDSTNGKVLGTAPIGASPDGAEFDEDKGLAFSSNRDGTLTVVKESSPLHFEAIQTLQTHKGSKTMILDQKSHQIYIPAAEYGKTPEVTKENPKPRPQLIPDSFKILVVGEKLKSGE